MVCKIDLKHQAIGRLLLAECCKALLKLNSADRIDKRFKLVATFHAVGRTNELSTFKWNDCIWNLDDECIGALWPEVKTLELKPVYFVFDYQCLETCFYHSCFCYFCIGGSDYHGNVLNPSISYVWPDLSQLG